MRRFLLSVLIITSLLLVACVQQRQPPAPPAVPAQVQEPAVPQQEAVQETPVTITILSAPSTVEEGDVFEVSWKIDGPSTTISHTAVHYGPISQPGDFGTDVGPGDAGYTNLTKEFAAVQSSIPGTFAAKLTATTSDKVYLRAHAIVDGKNYWTAENSVKINEKPPTIETARTYSISANDNAAIPSSLTIQKGTKFNILFNVDMDKVYYGGLDFRSSKFVDSGKVLPGHSWATPTLTADESFTIGAYWPASGVHKWDLQVIVS